MEDPRHQGLSTVAGPRLPTLYSAGLEERAQAISARCASAHAFLAELLEIRPAVTLLVLSRQDWRDRATSSIYGMPNFAAGNLIVAGEANDFWQGFVDLIVGTLPEGRDELTATYGTDSGISLAPFFDLLAIHELAHEFQAQRHLRFPRAWLIEFFCNVCLHAYVAVEEPDQLEVLETFPRLMSRIPPDRVTFRTLAAFEERYPAIVDGMNYGWYQCHLHVQARRLFDAGGLPALRRLWEAFQVRDDVLAGTLALNVHPEAEAVFTYLRSLGIEA